jgi:hypothetical protein
MRLPPVRYKFVFEERGDNQEIFLGYVFDIGGVYFVGTHVQHLLLRAISTDVKYLAVPVRYEIVAFPFGHDTIGRGHTIGNSHHGFRVDIDRP